MGNYFDQFDSKPAAGNYFDQFDPVVQKPVEAQGIAKQIGSGLIEGAASIPVTGPQLMKTVGDYLGEKFGLPKAEPVINAPPTPTEALTAALPPPQSGTEAVVRNLSQYPASLLGGGKSHLLENVVGALGAGAGSYFGPQVAAQFGMTPEQGALAGALAGGYVGTRVAGNTANAITRGAMPKPQDIIDETSNGYDNLKYANRSNIIPQYVMSTFKNGLLEMLRLGGPAEEQAKKTYSVVNGINTSGPGTMADIINARQNLHKILHGSQGADVPAAITALQGVDLVIEKGANPGTLAELKRLDTNWSAARTAQAVDTRVSQAQDRAEGANSGMNTGNNVIQNINAFIKRRTDPDTGKIHLAPSDLAALDQARKLDFGERATRMLSGAMGGGGGRDVAAAAGLGALGAFGVNQAGANFTENKDPIIAGAALPVLGLLGRHVFNRGVVRAAKNAEAQILARAPSMQGVSIPRNLLSVPQVTARSLLFAAPAIRDELTPDAQ